MSSGTMRTETEGGIIVGEGRALAGVRITASVSPHHRHRYAEHQVDVIEMSFADPFASSSIPIHAIRRVKQGTEKRVARGDPIDIRARGIASCGQLSPSVTTPPAESLLGERPSVVHPHAASHPPKGCGVTVLLSGGREALSPGGRGRRRMVRIAGRRLSHVFVRRRARGPRFGSSNGPLVSYPRAQGLRHLQGGGRVWRSHHDI